ncbi:MAG: ATP synthase F1 subunit delta [Phycisphaerales bacterium]|nr:ATP synthase F1 subunit delta [Phycisphaerales bacterium]
MGAADPKTQAIAGVYADAILGLAEERKQADALLDEIVELQQLLDTDATLGAFLTSAQIDAKQRAATIEKVLRGRAGDLLVDALQVINAKGRMELLPEILESYRSAHDAARKISEVQVTTAVPLAEDLRASLKAAAERYTGGAVKLVESVDESLLGGLIVRVGDVKLDTSLSRHLRRLYETVHEHGDRAIHGEAEKRFVEGALV